MTRFFLLLLAVASLALAESPIELQLPGEMLLNGDAHDLALGGSAEARWDLASGLPSNPALLASLDGVTYASVLQFRIASRDTIGGTWKEGRQDFPAFQFTLALPKDWRLGIGYRSLFRTRASYSLSGVVEDVPEGDWDGSYQTHLSQSGGQGSFPISLAWAWKNHLRLGADLSLLRGNLLQEWEYDFPAEASGIYDRKIRRSAEWSGTQWGAGLQARPAEGFSLSLHYRGESNLQGEQSEEVSGEEEDTPTGLEGVFPASWSAGLAWKLPGTQCLGSLRTNLVLSANWLQQSWSQSSLPLTTGKLRDLSRLGLGLEWNFLLPRVGLREERNIPLRLGFRHANLPTLDPLEGSYLEEILWSLGTGFKVQDGKGDCDLAFFLQEYQASGKRVEFRWGMALSLRSTEKWKRRTHHF
ncbi:MAG: hypothetical protein QF492_06720 [Candidatus Krumholzibacteria bacterium]|nr:hypothetical protein [Candidatus Krumholzibacteria bacterium]MDP6669576.1 hypothetical protein [Candidatus Krumholzibacteria bacterium]MDP6796433.1 hypothetical protein [Candidatus Krumholzibacteria bacterium]MDP7021050.1 hypothetical protein [Candidatus Krumholzibacteria bacterium]